MAPNSRPPLTSRIRASFEGKRSKSELTSPTAINGFLAQDPEAFRKALDEALNSETFQNAIASNLAKIISPSIKDALDTLQPLVESVYSHEVLLRKTNRGVENMLERIDTQQSRNLEQTPTPSSPRTPQRVESFESAGMDYFKQSFEKSNKRTVMTLAELSSVVESNNKKISEAASGIESIQATLGPIKDDLDALKTFTDQSTTTASVLQAQLDQLKEDIGLVVDAVGSNLGKNVENINQQVAEHPALLETHATKLDAITTDLAGLKGAADISEKIESISAQLEELKAAVESRSGAPTETGGASTSPEVIEALQKSNDFHASHATILNEIKERSFNQGSEPAAASTGGESDPAALQALQAEITTIKENIETGFASTGENIAGLSSKVDEMSSKIDEVSSKVDEVSSKVDTVSSTVEEHKAADNGADILAAVQKSNDSHASHAEALEGVKSLGGSGDAAPASYDTNFAALEAQLADLHSKMEAHSGSLEQIKSTGGGDAVPASYDANFAALEAQIAALHTKMEAHSGSLDEIKSAGPSTSREVAPVEAGGDVAELQSEVTAIISKLDAQTSIITELKDNISAEILTSLHDLGQAQTSHTQLLTEIRETDVSAEILTALHSANESHASHVAAFEKLDAAVQASSGSTRSVEEGAPAGDSSGLESHITALAATLEEHKATLAEIKDATNASNESHAAHIVSLDELKSKSVEPAPAAGSVDLAPLEEKIGAVLTALDDHKTTLTAIHEGTTASNESHAAHALTLGELKTARPAEPADAAPSGDVSGLETQIGSIITTLEEQNVVLAAIKDSTTASHDLHTAHAGALDEIKAATASANESHAAHTAAFADLKSVQPREESTGSEGGPNIAAFETHLNAILGTLEEQSGTLAEIKGAPSDPDLLAAIKANHDILASYGPVLETIKDGISQEEILNGITELKAAVVDSKSGVDAHGALVKDLHEEAMTSNSEIALAIGALALGGAAGAGTVAALSSGDDDTSKEILEEVKAARAQIDALSEGVHFNEKGVDQLKEHSTNAGGGAAISEATPPTADEPVGEAAPEPVVEEAVPEPVVQEAEPESVVEETVPEPEPVAEEAAPEPVVEEAVPEPESAVEEAAPEPVVEEPVPEPEPVVEAAEETVPEPEPVVEEPVTEPEPVVEEAVPEPEPVVEEAAPEPVEESVPEPADEPAEPVAEPEPVVEEAVPEPEPVVEEAEPEPVVEETVPEPEPAVEEAAPEPVVEEAVPEPEPVVKEAVAEPEPVEESVPEPADEPAEPVAEPEPVVEEAVPEPEPVVEEAEPEPVVEAVPESEPVVGEPVAEPEPVVEEAAPEPAVEETPVGEPIPEEKVEEAAAEPVVEEPVSELVVEEAPVEEPVIEETKEPEPEPEVVDEPVAEKEPEVAPAAEEPIEEAVIEKAPVDDMPEDVPEDDGEEPATPIEENPMSPMSPMSPGGETDGDSSAFATPSGPLSPTTGVPSKKSKKEKKKKNGKK